MAAEVNHFPSASRHARPAASASSREAQVSLGAFFLGVLIRLSFDPSSYLHLRLGAVISGGFSIDLYPHGGSITISAGFGAGEAGILKPPATLSGDIPIE